MKKFFVFLIIVIFAGNPGAFGYQSLQEIFDNSGPCYGYDRYMVLDQLSNTKVTSTYGQVKASG